MSVSASAGSGPAVLLIDDEGCIRMSVTRVLERAGYRVTSVPSGADALERVRGESFAAVICDIRMPGLSGIALFDQLQQANPGLVGRILVASGDLGQPETTVFLQRTGAPALLKPYGSADLLAALGRICEAPPARKPAQPRAPERSRAAS